ncbi:hypothetical protein EV183_000299, partial [Coemansia sp. RSA 2336]
MGMAILDFTNTEYYKYQSFNALWVIMMLYGSVAALYYVISAADIMMDLFVRDPVSLDDYGADKGHWAVIAECANEVGRELALQLSKKGFNIILLSRDSTAMKSLESRILTNGRQVKSCTIDFSSKVDCQWDELRGIIDQAHISVLVNNIGNYSSIPKFFDGEDEEVCNKMVHASVSSVMDVTRLVVPQMQARKNGLIINMGSFTALRSMPFMSVYAGANSFIKIFSQSLAYELEPDGIMVSYVFGHADISNLLGIKINPNQFVGHIFDRLGLRCGAHDSHTSIPYYPHSILNFISSCLWDPVHAKPAQY